jgi:hypothetical protein
MSKNKIIDVKVCWECSCGCRMWSRWSLDGKGTFNFKCIGCNEISTIIPDQHSYITLKIGMIAIPKQDIQFPVAAMHKKGEVIDVDEFNISYFERNRDKYIIIDRKIEVRDYNERD